MQRIIITGADGRMGRALIQAVVESEGVELAGAVVAPNSTQLGNDAGTQAGLKPSGINCVDSLESVIRRDDIVIDFTAPEATLAYFKVAREKGGRLVVGTTGFNEQQTNELNSLRTEVPSVVAGNYSVGVNLSLQLLRLAAKVMGDTSDIEVIEAHHRHKVDAPSGTALMMGEAVAEALGKDVRKDGVFSREGITGAREPGTIGFSTIRGGDIVGEHTVMFAAEGERLEISHKASSRQTFARGAVRAAKWLSEQQKPGLYAMEDVLGF